MECGPKDANISVYEHLFASRPHNKKTRHHLQHFLFFQQIFRGFVIRSVKNVFYSARVIFDLMRVARGFGFAAYTCTLQDDDCICIPFRVEPRFISSDCDYGYGSFRGGFQTRRSAFVFPQIQSLDRSALGRKYCH